MCAKYMAVLDLLSVINISIGGAGIQSQSRVSLNSAFLTATCSFEVDSVTMDLIMIRRKILRTVCLLLNSSHFFNVTKPINRNSLQPI